MSRRLILLADIDAPGGVRRLATELYCSNATDSPANTLYEDRLLAVTCERAIAFSVWTRTGAVQPVSFVELMNADGALDSWRNEAWRDRSITLRLVSPKAAYSTAVTVGRVVIEKLEAPAINRIRFVCRSTLERLAKPITTSYDSAVNNTVVRGQPRPMVVGRVRWADSKARRVNSGFTRGIYDVTDAIFESIVELRSRGVIQSETNTPLLPGGSGYFVDHFESFGFLFGPQLYRLAAEVRGNLRRSATITTNGTFPIGTGSNPDGWTRTTAGGSVIDWLSAGVVEMTGDNDTCTLTQTHATTTGQLYQVEVHFSSVNGSFDITVGGVAIRDFIDVSIPRVVCATFAATGSSTSIGVSIPVSTTGKTYVYAVRVYPVARIDSLTETVRYAAERVGLSVADIDDTATAAIDSAAGYRTAFASTQEVSGEQLARLCANSFGVAFFESINGKLKPVRLAAPSGSPSLEIQEWQVDGDIGYEIDRAEGLSGRMNWGRNYVVHSDDDMQPVNDQAQRAELARETSTVTTTVSLHSMYADAMQREPLESILSEQSHAQTEINRLCTLYTVVRAFYTIRINLDNALDALQLEPGQTIRLVHRRYGLSTGRNLLVVVARGDFGSGYLDLVLWGDA